MKKERLDKHLVDLGYYETKSKAAAAILAGDVKIGTEVITKAGYQIDISKQYEFNIKSMPYVSRGGFKLKKALESFDIKVQDEGVSTIQNIDYERKEIALNQINAGTEIELQIPIELAKNEIYNIQNLNKNNKVVFTGIYVTEKGKEVEIEKEIFLNIAWDTNVSLMLEHNVNKYINILESVNVKTTVNKLTIVNNQLK